MSTKPEAIQFANDRPTGSNDDVYDWAVDAEVVIRTQHADLERKDALLKQALEAMKDYFDYDKFGLSVKAMQAITKELSQ